MDSNTLARGMRYSVAEGGFATAMTSLFSGLFLTGFALAIGANDMQIGLLISLPSLCGVMQLAGSYWLERHGNSRSFCLWTTGAARALYVPMVLIALFANGLSAQAKVWWIIAAMTLSCILASLGGMAWLSWIRAFVPDRMRVSFFGRRNLVNAGLSLVLCLAGGAVIERYGIGHDDHAGGHIAGFIVVFAIAIGCGFLSSALLAKIPAGAETIQRRRSDPWLKSLAAPLRETNFRRIVLFYTAWNLAANLSIPFFTVFYIRNLGLPLGYIVVLTTLTSLTGLLANNFWTRLAERFGLKPIVLLATIGDALYPLCLVFVGMHSFWALLLVHCYGFFNTPITIGPDNFVLKLLPERNNASYIAVFKAAIGLATMVGGVLGGWLAQSPLLGGATSAAAMIGSLKIIFLLSFLGRIASLFLLAGVVEPGALPVGAVVLTLANAGRSLWPVATAPLATPFRRLHRRVPAGGVIERVGIDYALEEALQ